MVSKGTIIENWKIYIVSSSLYYVSVGNEETKDLYYCLPAGRFLKKTDACDDDQNCKDYVDELSCGGMSSVTSLSNPHSIKVHFLIGVAHFHSPGGAIAHEFSSAVKT